MDIENLKTHTELSNFCGSCINIEERMKISLAVNELRTYEKFDKVFFWGRIQGIEKDYYIIEGVNFKDFQSFPQTKFYWCYNDFHLTELPHIDDEKRAFLSHINGYFYGHHDRVLRKADTPPATDNTR